MNCKPWKNTYNIKRETYFCVDMFHMLSVKLLDLPYQVTRGEEAGASVYQEIVVILPGIIVRPCKSSKSGHICRRSLVYFVFILIR